MALLDSTRPPAPRGFRRGALSILTVLVLAAASVGSWEPAHAQTTIDFPAPPPPRPKSKAAIERDQSGDKQMLVQAAEIDYDYANNRVSAVGNVQIY